MSDILNNPKQVLQSAMDCKEFSHNHNCKGCPHMIGDYYQGETDDYCFDDMMDNSTNDKAEMMVQMYLLGGLDGIKAPIRDHGCSVDFQQPITDGTKEREQMPGINGEIKKQTRAGTGLWN